MVIWKCACTRGAFLFYHTWHGRAAGHRFIIWTVSVKAFFAQVLKQLLKAIPHLAFTSHILTTVICLIACSLDTITSVSTWISAYVYCEAHNCFSGGWKVCQRQLDSPTSQSPVIEAYRKRTRENCQHRELILPSYSLCQKETPTKNASNYRINSSWLS